jgi:cytochrome c biogenesis protein ResB
LTSPRLALGLLVAVLACCIVGVTVLRGAKGWEAIFSTYWFNALLVLLAISSAAAFFSRIWRRKLTLVSAGMILFHLSFAALLCGVVFNSLFHFKAVLRLTEGETLSLGEVQSYDSVEVGRFFDFSRLRGEAKLERVILGYRVEGRDKRVAYEVTVGPPEARRTGHIWVTHELEHDGVRFLASKEGYSVLVGLADGKGREIYAAHVPLQSLKQPDGGFLYATGSQTEPLSFPFPPPPEEQRCELIVTFRPNAVKEREGDVGFEVFRIDPASGSVRAARGTATVGGQFDAGGLIFSAREIRYWAAMDVRRDPGLWVILASLCVGLVGMVLTFVGRLRRAATKPASQST